MTRYSLGIWGNTVDEMATFASEAEAAGFEAVWAHELHRSAVVPIAAAAAKTRTIEVGTGIQLAFARSPMVTALTAMDLDDLSGGRFNLGLGSGVRRLNEKWHGVSFGSPVKHFRETIEVIRTLTSLLHTGKALTYEGEYYDLDIRGLKRPWPPRREKIPIFVAAVGPLMAKLAGSHADGWIGHELNSVQWVADVILPNVDRGLRESGRARNDFRVVLTVCCAVNSDRREAIRQVARTIAFYATVRTYRDFFAASGFGEQADEIGGLFRAGNEEGMFAAVPEEMVHTFGAAGTPDEVRARLKELEPLADVLNLSPPHTFLDGEEIIENIRAMISLVGRP